MELKSIVAVLLLIGAVAAIPTRLENARCAQTCASNSLINSIQGQATKNFEYAQGQTYQYAYQSVTRLRLPQGDGPTVQLQAKALIAVVDDCNMILQLRDVRVQGPVDSEAFKAELEANPLSFSFDDGRIQAVCPSSDDEEWALNVKKSILSALQVSPKTLGGRQIVREQDILGNCQTQYVFERQNSWTRTSQIAVKKTKQAQDCLGRNQASSALIPRAFAQVPAQVFGNKFTCEQKIAERIVKSASCQETNGFLPLRFSNRDAQVESSVQLQFVKVTAGISAGQFEFRARQGLLYASNPMSRSRRATEQSAAEALRRLDQQSKNGLKEDAPEYYNEVVAELSQLSTQSVQNLWQQVKNNQIGAQGRRLRDLFLDALAEGSSEGTLAVLTQVINNKEISETKATYYLVKLTLFNDADEGAVRAALRLVDGKSKVNRQALLALGSMASKLNDKRHGQPQEVKLAAQAIAKYVTSSDERLAFAACKALETIGQIPSEARQALLQVATGNYHDNVQAAAIAALYEVAYLPEVKQAMLQIFQKQDEDVQVRIAAYRCIMKAPTRSDLQQVISHLEQRERSTQVGSYVTSHLANLRQTSDPTKQSAKDVAKSVELKRQFPREYRKYSSNIEWSAHPSPLQSGATFEANVIYTDEPIPTYFEFNATSAVGQEEFNFVEFGIYQQNLDQGIQEAIEGLSKKADDVPDMIKSIVKKLTGADKKKASKYQLEEDNSYESSEEDKDDDVEVHMYLNFDGRTAAVMFSDDFDYETKQGINWQEIIDRLFSGERVDRAMGLQLAQTTFEVPTISGVPMQVEYNVTALAAFNGLIKANLAQIKNLKNPNGDVQIRFNPSFALQASTRFGMQPHRGNKQGVKLVTKVTSNPYFDLDAKLSNNHLRAGLNIPQEEMVLFKAASQVYVVDAQGREQEIQPRHRHHIDLCTSAGQKMTGLQLCIAAQAPSPLYNRHVPVIPLNGPISGEVIIRKTDNDVKRLEVSADYTQNSQNLAYSIQFNTPGSKVNRLTKGEVQIQSNSRTGEIDVAAGLQAPGKQMKAKAALKNGQNKVALKAAVSVDGRNKVQCDAAIQKAKDTRSGRTTFRPEIRIQFANQKQPLQATGVVSVQQGRKQQIDVQLKAGSSNQHQMSANLAKDGECASVNGECRLSLNGQVNSPAVGSAQVHVQAAKTAQSVSFDANTAYQGTHRSSKKETFRVAGKVNNLSTGNMAKINVHIQTQSSANPEANVDATYNAVYRPGHHVEQEVNAQWGRHQTKKENQIKCLVKAQKQTSGAVARAPQASQIDAVFACQVGPLDMDVDARASARAQSGATPKWRFAIQAQDKNDKNKNVQALAEYQLASRKPLKVAMQAKLETPKNKFSYRDQLSEVRPSEYHGKTELQWGRQTKNATLQYQIVAKATGRNVDYQVDARLQTPKNNGHHRTALKVAPQQVSFATQTQVNGEELMAIQVAGKRAAGELAAQLTAAAKVDDKKYDINNQLKVDAQQFKISSSAHKNAKKIYVASIDAQQVNALAARSKTSDKVYQIEAQFETRKNQYKQQIEARQSHGISESQSYQLTAQTEKDAKKLLTAKASISKSAAATQAKIEAQYECPKTKNSYQAQAQAQMTGKEMIQGSIRAQKNQKQVLQAQISAQQTSSQVKLGAKAQYECPKTGKSYDAAAQCQVSDQEVEIQARATKNQKQVFKTQLAARQLAASGEYQADAQVEYQHPKSKNQHKLQGKVTLNEEQVKVECQKQKNGQQQFNVQAQAEKNANGQKQAQIQIDAQKNKHRDAFRHQTKMTVDEDRFEVRSETEKNGQQIGKVQLMAQQQGAQQQSAEIQVEYQCPKKHSKNLKHETQIKRFNDQLQVSSQTQKNGRLVYQVQGKVQKSVGQSYQAQAEVKTQRHQYQANSEVSYADDQAQVKADLQKNGQQMYQIQGQYQEDGKSQLSIKAQRDSAQLIFDDANDEASLRIDCQRCGKFQHKSQAQWKNNDWRLESQTEADGHKWAQIDALSRKSMTSMKIDLPEFDFDMDAAADWELAQFKGQLHCDDFEYGLNFDGFDKDDEMSINAHGKKSGKMMAELESKVNRNGRCVLHMQTPIRFYRTEVQPFGAQKMVAVEYKDQSAPQVYHKTQILADAGKTLSLTSVHQRRGQQVMNLDAMLSRNAPSTFSYASPMTAASVECDPFSRTNKFAQWTYKQNRGAQNDHFTKVEFKPRQSQVIVVSRHNQRGQQLASLEAQLNAQMGASSLAWNHPYSGPGTFQLNPFGKAKAVTFEIQGQQRQHKTVVNYIKSRNGHKVTIESRQKYNNSPYASVEANLNSDSASNLAWIHPRVSGSVIVDPYSAQKVLDLQAQTRRQQHQTKIQYNPAQRQWIIKSTQAQGASQTPYMSLNADLNPYQGASIVDLVHPRASANLNLQPFGAQKSMEVQVKSPAQSHQTKVKVSKNKVTIVSRHDIRRRPYSLDAEWNRRAASSLVYDLANNHDGQILVNPYAAQKQFTIKINSNKQQARRMKEHATDIIMSSGKNGRIQIQSVHKVAANPMYSLNADLPVYRRQVIVSPASLNLQSGRRFVAINYQPENAKRNLDWSYVGPRYAHKSQVIVVPTSGAAVISHMTEKNGRQMIKFGGNFNRRAAVHAMDFQSGLLDADMSYNRAQRAASWKIAGKPRYMDLQHQTSIKVNPEARSVEIKSKTTRKGVKKMDLDTVLSSLHESRFDCDSPLFTLNARAQPTKETREIKFDLKNKMYRFGAGRRILGAVAAGQLPKSQYQLDLKWDADRNPSKKLTVKVHAASSRSKKQMQLNTEVNYQDKYDVNMVTSLNKDLISGPHDIEVTLKKPDVKNFKAQTIKFHHVAKNDESQCTLRFLQAGEEKVSLQLNGQCQSDRNGFKFTVGGQMKSAYRDMDGKQIQLNIRKTANNNLKGADEFMVELRAEAEPGKPWIIRSDVSTKVTLRKGSVKASASLQRPESAAKDQEARLDIEWQPRNGKLEATLKAPGQQEASLVAQVNMEQVAKLQAFAELNSDINMIPDMKAHAAYDLSSLRKKSAQFYVDVDQDRKIDLSAGYDYQSRHNYNAHLNMDCPYTPKVACQVQAVKDSAAPQKYNYEATLKVDAEELFAAKASANKNRNQGWTGAAFVSAKGADLARLDLEHDLISTQESKYMAKYEGPIQPFRISFRKYKDANEIRPSVTICDARELQKCVSAQASYRKQDTQKGLEREALLEIKQGASTDARLTWAINTKTGYAQKLELNVNGARIGYQADYKKSGRQQLIDGSAKLMLPQRTMEVIVQQEKQGEAKKTTIEFLPRAVRQPENKLAMELTHKAKGDKRGSEVDTQIKISHPQLTRPITGRIFYENKADSRLSKPVQVTLTLDAAKDPSKKTTLTAFVESNNNDHRNKSIAIQLFNADRSQYDAGIRAHVAAIDEQMSAGFLYHFKNAQKKRQQGFYLVQLDQEAQEAQFYAHQTQGRNGNQKSQSYTEAEAKWSTKDNDRVNVAMKLCSDRECGSAQEKHAQLTLELTKPCAQLTLGSRLQQDNKVHICADVSNRNVLQLSSESIIEGQKAAEASIQFDKRSGQTLKGHIHWSPATVKEILADVAAKYEAASMPQVNVADKTSQLKNKMAQKAIELANELAEEAIVPLAKALAAEAEELMDELDEPLKPVAQAFAKAIEALPEYEEIREAYEQFIQAVEKKLNVALSPETKAKLAKIAQAFESYSEEVVEIIARIFRAAPRVALEAVSQAHRVVVATKGKLGQQLVQLPAQWGQQLASNPLVQKAALYFQEYIQQAKINAQLNIQQALQYVQQMIAQTLADDQDAERMIEAFKNLADDVTKALEGGNYGKVAQMTSQAFEMALSPKTWASHSRQIVYDPIKGELQFTLRQPFKPKKLQAFWTKSSTSTNATQFNKSQAGNKYNSLRDRLNKMKALLRSPMLPPYPAQGMIVAGQHIVTFDRQFYDFAGSECSYLLARQPRFEVYAKYLGQVQGRVQKAIIVRSGAVEAEIHTTEGLVKLHSRPAELPLRVGPASIFRQGNVITIDNRQGRSLIQCDLAHDVCTFAVSGKSFGKTQGLLGDYNNEMEDVHKANMGGQRSAEEFARRFVREQRCRARNVAQAQQVQRASREWNLCEKYFVAEESPLRAGFAIVHPDNYFQMCLRHQQAARGYRTPQAAACTVAAAYVKDLRFNGFKASLPRECLACQSGPETTPMQYASRSILAPKKSADVVFVVEEHQCAQQVVEHVGTVAKLVEKELKTNGFQSNRYGLVGFGGQKHSGKPHAHTSQGRILFNVQNIQQAADQIEYRRSSNRDGRIDDALEALNFAAEHPWRVGSSRNLVLITCSDCKENPSRYGLSELKAALRAQGISLHIITDRVLESDPESALSHRQLFEDEHRQRHAQTHAIYAYDAEGLYRGKDASLKTLFPSRKQLPQQVATPDDVCTVLAQSTNGAIFSSIPAQAAQNDEARLWKQLVARIVSRTATQQPLKMEKNCRCVAGADGLTARTVCTVPRRSLWRSIGL